MAPRYDLDRSDIRGSGESVTEKINMKGTNMEKINMKGTSMEKINMKRTNMEKINMKRTNMEEIKRRRRTRGTRYWRLRCIVR